jgi:hypothetical protein
VIALHKKTPASTSPPAGAFLVSVGHLQHFPHDSDETSTPIASALMWLLILAV